MYANDMYANMIIRDVKTAVEIAFGAVIVSVEAAMLFGIMAYLTA